ncbi:HNH endonuclease signature motif containing protein [Paeniglutamicibacter sp. NPDC091659]|uniref:HNH endonuclease signature motif containing protein n=1 Tax=Paeniglutamicibacter sp. NPDC091659 TaxID=3364389 RepID=UPI00381712F8
METAQFVESVAGRRGDPGHLVTTDDKLRALLVAMAMCDSLCEEISKDASSPTRAAFHASVVERHSQRMEIAQIRAAGTAQRTLVHELPPETLTTLRNVADDPWPFTDGKVGLPADPSGAPTGRPEYRNTAEALQRTLRISYFAARDRLHAAWSLLPRTDINGIPQGPRFPVLAGQLDSGSARVQEIAAAARKLDRLRPGIEARPDARDLALRVEEQVARSVAEDTPRETNKLFDAISDRLDAVESEPTQAEIREKTGIFVTRRTRHFTYLSACMLNDDAEIFMSHFAQSDNPRTQAGDRRAMADAATVPGAGSGSPAPPPWIVPDPSAGPVETLPPLRDFDFGDAVKDRFNSTSPGPDGLTPPQRHLQTLVNVMRSAGKPPGTTGCPGNKGSTGLPSARLVVLVKLEVLMGLAKGAGYSAHGLEIPIGRVRRMLASDGVIPIVLGGQGEILDVGREKRLLPGHMKRAVLARDGGCLYPGCTVPPELCEFNHIEQWQDGGATSVANCHPACTAHHHMIDNGELRVVIHQGLPHVVLPGYLDPQQRPRRNTYWQPANPTLF